MTRHRDTLALALALALPAAANAQFDPLSAQWGKLDTAHIRIVTWNVEDGISSRNAKQDIVNDWNALVRVMAVLQPDVLLLQEAGDNSGNGQPGGLDSVADLETTLRLFIEGGNDPFLGGTVTSFVQLWAPGWDLPHIYVSEESDFGINSGFNRNVVLSRWPFADLNGDGKATVNDIPFVSSPFQSGDGGIRGTQVVEIDLPDDLYAGDLVVTNSHFKSGGSVSDENQRTDAAQNVGFFIDAFYNGAGSGTVDPDNAVNDVPPATSILGPHTPVVAGGDWNTAIGAPLLNPANIKSGALWLTELEFDGPPDGADRDRSDMAIDNAKRRIIFNNNVFEGSGTTTSLGKIDYIAFQDSIVSEANSFVYDPFEHDGIYPPSVDSYPGQPFNIVKDAADHLPVTVDLVFAPAPDPECAGDITGDGATDVFDFADLVAAFGATPADPTWNPDADLVADNIIDVFDFADLVAAFGCDL